MPVLNRKGPNGYGPMTGRKMGRCNPENKGKTDDEIIQSNSNSSQSDQRMGPGRRRGMGKGKGLGKGMRFRGNV